MIDELLAKVKPKNRKIVVILVPLLCGLLASWNLVVHPGLSKITAAHKELRSLGAKEITFGSIADSEKRLTDFQKKLPKAGDKMWLVDQLNSIANATNFLILSVTPDEQKMVVGGFLERTSIHIEAQGNYHELGEFVSQVESLEQLVKISRVDVTAATFSSGMDGRGDGSARHSDATCRVVLSVGLLSPLAGIL